MVLDEPLTVAMGSEPIRVDGAVVGRVTSGGYGFTVAASIAYGYLPVALAAPGTRCEVEVFGDWIGATVSAEPLYDPANARVRG
jgi:4-methylaminobutanoate oxidase (formaldehyde-forming)